MATSPTPESPSARLTHDGIANVVTGIGTNRDPRSYNQYCLRRLSDQEIDASYRSSWVMRKIIDKPATELVREWRDWQAEAGQIKLIEALERKLDLRNKVRRAETLRGLGGCGMVLWIGNEDPALPVNPRSLKAGSLRGIHVWHKSRFHLEDMETDPASDWYGYPKFYKLQSRDNREVRIHPSRVIAFRGLEVSDISTVSWQDAFWGDSRVQSVMDAVQNLDTAQNGFAALIKDARNRRIGIPGMTNMLATADGERILTNRMNAVAQLESMLGVTFYDSGSGDGKGGETIDDRQMVWAGIPEISASYASFAAAAGDMPATILLGKSPDGMNATGKGDMDAWEKTIKAKQDLDLRPCLDQLDAVLVPSALGVADPDIWWNFAPLSVPTEKEEADTFKIFMEAVTSLTNTGMIPDIAMSKAVQTLLSERGWLPGLDGALAELPEDERFPSLDDPEEERDEDEEDIETPPLRRAANDRKRWRDAEGGGRQAEPPFADGKRRHKGGPPHGGAHHYNESDHPRGLHGRWETKGSIQQHVSRALGSGKEQSATSVGKVSVGNAAKVREQTGIDISGHERVLQSSDIRHVIASHGDPAVELARGQVAIAKADFSRIPEIVERSHTVSAIGASGSRKPLRLEYVAKLESHEYRYVEELRGNKVVALKSMLKKL